MNIHHNDKYGNAVSTGALQPMPTREGDPAKAVYCSAFTVTPTGAADYFAYIENKSNQDITVLLRSIYTTAAELITIESAPPGVPAGTTNRQPVNKRLGDNGLSSSYIAVQSGVDLNSAAGLVTAAAAINPILVHQSPANTDFLANQKFVLPAGRAIQFLAGTGATVIGVNLDFWINE